ncbi:MAG: D-alanyl-D-alanine carboxypeptidase/D-alanyl-D-alanine-endopeptidase [Gemmatimonadales bacterium]|nr:D-alanyl-D-alanine carboxypeptidase/D-alanyl-D-alanine-endopeptidase [Gemmatimonadales bacterium]
MTEKRRKGQATGAAIVWQACILTVALVLLFAVPPFRRSAVLHAQSLAKRLDTRLDTPPFDRSLWGVSVVDHGGKLLYGRNQHRLFTPASNAKLVVTAVAAALLPPDFTVRTSLYAAGPVVGGVLRGDLVLYGRGDPTFSRRCYATDSLLPKACDRDPFARLRLLTDTLKARGIRQVAGDLVGDGSYFEPASLHPGWELFDLSWWYAAPVAALAFNDNSLDFVWQPGAAVGAPALISMWPDLGDVAFENRTVTVPAGGETDIGDRFFRQPGTAQVWAEGTVALDRPARTESFAVADPNLFAARALRQALADAGIAVTGTTRSTTDSAAYAGARARAPLAETTSRPLRDWIFPILNTSQNLFAEMLVKQLGKRFGGGGSWREGLAVERRFLIDSVRIDSTEFLLSDGSGLSSANLMSPHAFTRLLRYIRAHPRFSTFAPGLPRSGGTGNLRTRFAGTPVAGRVHAKTGSIAGVNTLAGYIERPGSPPLTFSIELNHHAQPSRAVLAAIDSVVVEIGRGR